MRCIQCGHENKEDGGFCVNCGKAAPQPATETPPPENDKQFQFCPYCAQKITLCSAYSGVCQHCGRVLSVVGQQQATTSASVRGLNAFKAIAELLPKQTLAYIAGGFVLVFSIVVVGANYSAKDDAVANRKKENQAEASKIHAAIQLAKRTLEGQSVEQFEDQGYSINKWSGNSSGNKVYVKVVCTYTSDFRRVFGSSFNAGQTGERHEWVVDCETNSIYLR